MNFNRIKNTLKQRVETTPEEVTLDLELLEQPLAVNFLTYSLGSQTPLLIRKPEVKLYDNGVVLTGNSIFFSIDNVTTRLEIQREIDNSIKCTFNLKSQNQITFNQVLNHLLKDLKLENGEIIPMEFQKELDSVGFSEVAIGLNLSDDSYYFFGEGSFFNIKGSVSLQILTFLRKKHLSFQIKLQHQPISIGEILKEYLKINIGTAEKFIPGNKFSLQEISYHELAGAFTLEGTLYPGSVSGNEKGYELSGKINVNWKPSLAIQLTLDATDHPVKLSALEKDLPFSLEKIKEVIPLTVVDNIAATEFLSASISINTANKEFDISGSVNLFGKLKVYSQFHYSESDDLAFKTYLQGSCLSVKEIVELLGLNATIELPNLKIGIHELAFSQKERSFYIRGEIQTKDGSSEITLFLQLFERGTFKLFFDYSAKSNEISIGDLITSILPATWVETLPKNTEGKGLLQKLSSSALTKFQLDLNTSAAEVSLSAGGNLLGLTGQLWFSVMSILDQRFVSFRVIGEESNAVSIVELLKNRLCIPIDPQVEKFLPIMKVGLTELGYDQLDGRFLMSGIVSEGSDTREGRSGYKLKGNIAIEWEPSLILNLSLDGKDSPMSFQDFIEDLPVPVEEINKLIPVTFLEEIKFYYLNISFDSKNKKSVLNSVVGLFDSVVSSDLQIYQENSKNYFSLQTTIDEIDIQKLLSKTGIGAFPTSVPNLVFRNLVFSIDTKTETVSFKGSSALTTELKIGESKLALRLAIDTSYNFEKKLKGSLEGELDLAGVTFAAKYELSEHQVLSFEPRKSLKEGDPTEGVDLKTFINNLIPGAGIPNEVPNVKIKNLSGSINLSTLEFSYNGSIEIPWDFLQNDSTLASTVSLGIHRKKNGDDKYVLDCSLTINSTGILKITDDIQFKDPCFNFKLKDEKWKLDGELEGVLYGKSFQIDALYDTSAGQAIKINGEADADPPLFTFGNVSLKKAYFNLTVLKEDGLNERKISGKVGAFVSLGGTEIKLSANYNNTASFSTKIPSILVSKLSKELLGLDKPEMLPDIEFKNIDLEVTPSLKKIKIAGEVEWKETLNIAGSSLFIESAMFDFLHDENGNIISSMKVKGKGQLSENIKFECFTFNFQYDKSEGWKLGGGLDLSVFNQEIKLNADATSLNGTNKISFSGSNLPTLHIPDALKLTENDHITSFELHKFAIALEQKEGVVANWLVSGTSDFTIWNPVAKGKKLLEVKAGELKLQGEGAQKSLSFIPGKAEVKPLGLFAFLPEALANGLTLGLGQLNIKQNQGNWNVEANAYLQIEESIFNELPGAEIISDLFPPPLQGEKRKMEGNILLSSKDGVSIKLTNNAIALTPDPSVIIKNALDEMLKNLKVVLNDKPELQPLFDGLNALKEQLPDTGKAYFCLRKIAINLSNKPSFEVQLALGLPEKLNEILFANLPEPLNKLKGIITTYDPNNTDLSVMTATLALSGNDGISGSLGNFPPVNWKKAADLVNEASVELKSVLANGITFITQNDEIKKLTDEGIAKENFKSIVINFDGIMDKPKDTYGAIAINVPKLSFSFKSGAFAISGGCRVLSDQLSIPIPLQPLFMLLGLPEASQYVPESIPVRSVSFIEKGNLSIDDLENYFIDCLPKKFKEPTQLKGFKELLSPLKQAVNTLGEEVVNKFPTAFKEYLGIRLPKGFHFDLNITADQSVNFSFEVDSPVYKITADHIEAIEALPGVKKLPIELLQKLKTLKDLEKGYENKPALSRAIRRILSGNEWKKHGKLIVDTITSRDFYDAIQVLVPMGLQPTLVGLRLRRVAFGTALFNQVFRVDFSGEIDVFNLIEFIPALFIPAPEEIADETLRLILPDPNQLQKSILLDQLVVFIIYYTGIPIPVPVYARELNIHNVGLLGDEEQLRWIVEANGGITSALKKMLQFKKFFSDDSSWLQLQEYPLGSSANEPELGLSLGPNFFKLPGIFGYEHDGQGNQKQPIVVGSTTPLDINFFDLIGVSANTAKGILVQKNITTPPNIDSPPLNYFIQYFPIEMRVGKKHIMLFHFFNIYAKWLLTTPQEFREGAWKRLNGVQTENELLSMVPLSSNSSPNEEGFVAFFQGGFEILEIAYFDTAFVMAATKKEFTAGFKMKGVLGDVFSTELKGAVKIVPEDKEKPVAIQGSGELIFCGEKILNGNVMLDNEGLCLSGQMNLFPQSDLIRVSGQVTGVFQKNNFRFEGKDIICAFGPLTLAAAHLTISDQEFTIKATLLNQTITLAVQQKEKSLRFFATMTPIKLGDLLQITDASGENGPIFYVELNHLNYEKPKTSVIDLRKANAPSDETSTLNHPETKNPFFQSSNLDAWTPNGNQFLVYLSGRIVILGIKSETIITFTDNHFFVHVKGNFLDLFYSELDITGKLNAEDPVWNGDDEWQSEGKWLDSNTFDWKNHGVFTFKGKIGMLGAILQSTGELSIQPLLSSGTIKLWIEEEQNNFLKGCDLNFSFQHSQTISRAHLVINGDIIQAALNFTLGTVKNLVNNYLNTAISNLEDFDRKIEAKKAELKKSEVERKKQLESDYEFWQKKVNDLKDILSQRNIEVFFERYINEAKQALLVALHNEKIGHTQWYFNGDWRWPHDRLAYEIKQKILSDMIWYVENGINNLLWFINTTKFAFEIAYPIIESIVQKVLSDASKALSIAKDLLNAVVDLETLIGTMALNAVQQTTGYSKQFLIESKNNYNKLYWEIDSYINNLPIKILKTTLVASLNQFKLASFDADIELLVKPSNGNSITKTVRTSIDFNDLSKTAKLLLEANKDVLGLINLPNFQNEAPPNSFANHTVMFSNEKVFATWLERHSNPQLMEQVNKLDEEKMEKLSAVYEKSIDINNEYSMYKVLEKLGEAIWSLVQLAAQEDSIATGEEKKQFVMENVINISKLMDNGISGEENNIHEEVQGFEFLANTDATIQEAFVHPMTDKLIESLWSNSNQY